MRITSMPYKFIIFAVIRLFVFKTVHGIGGKCLVIRKVYGFNDRSPPCPVCSAKCQ